jgi:hypothetical protein
MTESTELEIFTIPSWNMEKFNKQIVKMQKRAIKLGVPAISVIDHGTKMVDDPQSDQKKLKALKLPIPQIVVHSVEVVGEGPMLAGYKFLGTLDHVSLPGSVIVKTVPGESIPKQFYNHDAHCDHCNTIRRRKDTFVVQFEETGKYKQVGRNCLKDFFPSDPSAIARYLTSLWKFIEGLSDDEWFERGGFSGNQLLHFDHTKVLTITAGMIRTYGWVPRSAAKPEEGYAATADRVSMFLLPPMTKYDAENHQKVRDAIAGHEEADLKEAQDAIEWLKTQEDTNEYMHNLKAIADADAVPVNMFGFWCSVVAAYQRAQERLRVDMAQKKVSEWVGNVKERLDMEVKIMRLSYIDSRFGTVTLVKMLDSEGRSIVWFANATIDMEQGNTYKVKATVKKHDEYNGWKQTNINRLKVIEQVENDE